MAVSVVGLYSFIIIDAQEFEVSPIFFFFLVFYIALFNEETSNSCN